MIAERVIVLPNFLIIGAQKSGTTWLASMLRQHEDVYMPDRELHFFDKDFNFSKGLGWYKSHFSEAAGERAVGEKTPDYLWANGIGGEGHLKNIHQNIFESLPNVKLIIALRNPSQRAVSATKHLISTGRISPIHTVDDLLVGKYSTRIEQYGVIEMGRYFTHVKTYLERFGREKILVVVFEEDVVDDPIGGLATVCTHLGIDKSHKFQRVNESVNAFRHSKLHLIVKHYAPVFSPVTRVLNKVLPSANYTPKRETMDKLHARFESDTKRLFDLLERPIPETWLTI